jgi:hypothetical protein
LRDCARHVDLPLFATTLMGPSFPARMHRPAPPDFKI